MQSLGFKGERERGRVGERERERNRESKREREREIERARQRETRRSTQAESVALCLSGCLFPGSNPRMRSVGPSWKIRAIPSCGVMGFGSRTTTAIARAFCISADKFQSPSLAADPAKFVDARLHNQFRP